MLNKIILLSGLGLILSVPIFALPVNAPISTLSNGTISLQTYGNLHPQTCCPSMFFSYLKDSSTYSGIEASVLMQPSTNWTNVTIKYTNTSTKSINLSNLNLGFMANSGLNIQNPYFTSLCGVSEPTMNEECLVNGPFTFYVFNLKFDNSWDYTYLNPNDSVEISFGTEVSSKKVFITGDITPGYYYTINNQSNTQNGNINTNISWLTSSQDGQSYGQNSNCIITDIANQYFIWGYPLNGTSNYLCAGLLEIAGTGTSSGTTKLVAVTPQGFYLVTPPNPSGNDAFEVSLNNAPDHSSLAVVPPNTELAKGQTINQSGSFTLVDNTSTYMQYMQYGIPCSVSLIASNGVTFPNEFENYSSMQLNANNGLLTINYIVTNSDAAAIIAVKELDGFPRTCKLLLITENGIFQTTVEDNYLDDFELRRDSSITSPTFTVIPNTDNVTSKKAIRLSSNLL